MIKPKFKGEALSSGKSVLGHLFFTDDERFFISPTGSGVFGFNGDEENKHIVMVNSFEVGPETVVQVNEVVEDD